MELASSTGLAGSDAVGIDRGEVPWVVGGNAGEEDGRRFRWGWPWPEELVVVEEEVVE